MQEFLGAKTVLSGGVHFWEKVPSIRQPPTNRERERERVALDSMLFEQSLAVPACRFYVGFHLKWSRMLKARSRKNNPVAEVNTDGMHSLGLLRFKSHLWAEVLACSATAAPEFRSLSDVSSPAWFLFPKPNLHSLN